MDYSYITVHIYNSNGISSEVTLFLAALQRSNKHSMRKLLLPFAAAQIGFYCTTT
jgi:hypothetical protein